MKKNLISSKITKTENKSIDYENGITVDYIMIDDELFTYKFKSDKMRKSLTLISDDGIKQLKKTHWSEHHKITTNEEIKLTQELQLDTFNKFDNLLYIGQSLDGMLADRNKNFISTPIIFDSTFCQIYLDIETSKKECNEILKKLNNFVIKKDFFYIPSYNQNDEKNEHYTICFTALLPQDIYTKILNGKEHLGDYEKVETYKYLINEN